MYNHAKFVIIHVKFVFKMPINVHNALKILIEKIGIINYLTSNVLAWIIIMMWKIKKFA